MAFFKPCFPNGIKDFPFTNEDIRDIWAMAKGLRDQGLGPGKIIQALSDKLGMDEYHIAQAVQTPKSISRKLTTEAWAKAGAYRRIVSEAKMQVAEAQKAPIFQKLNALYEIPRGLKTFGHWAVYTGTHGGDFAFVPSEYGRFLKQWVRGWRAIDPKYFDRAVEAHMAQYPLHDQFAAAGLDNNPYQHATGIYARKPLIPLPDTLRAGPRGYGTLALARDALMDDLWNRVKRIDPNAGKDQMRELATQVNHVWGSAKLGRLGPTVSKFIFATKLLPARLLSTFVDIPKAAGTFLNWRNANAAQRVAALFQARRLVQFLAVHHGLVAANAAWNKMHGGPQVNMTNPGRVGDWMAFKLGGLTLRPPSAILEAERLLAGIAYATLGGGKKSAGDVLKDYASGKLNPAIHLANEIATGVNWAGERTPFKGLKERITGEPPKDDFGRVIPPSKSETPGQYVLERVTPIPVGGASREIYNIFKQQGLKSEEASAWMRALSDPRTWEIGAAEAQGVTARETYKYKPQPPNQLQKYLRKNVPALGQ